MRFFGAVGSGWCTMVEASLSRRQRDRHVVLQRVRRFVEMPSLKNANASSSPVGRRAVAREVGHAVERARLGLAAARGARAAHPFGQRAGVARHRQVAAQDRAQFGVRDLVSSVTTSRGWCGRRRRAPSRPPARVQPKLGDRLCTTFAPAAVVPAPPKRAPRPFSSVSAKKLSDGGSVRPSSCSIVGEAPPRAASRPRGCSAAPPPCATATPRRAAPRAAARAAYAAGACAPFSLPVSPRLNDSALSVPFD